MRQLLITSAVISVDSQNCVTFIGQVSPSGNPIFGFRNYGVEMHAHTGEFWSVVMEGIAEQHTVQVSDDAVTELMFADHEVSEDIELAREVRETAEFQFQYPEMVKPQTARTATPFDVDEDFDLPF